MKRFVATTAMTAGAMAALAGMATSAHAVGIGPTSVYLWTGHDYGAGVGNAPGALAYNGGATPIWAWQASSMGTSPLIDNNGRIYFGGAVRSSVGIAAIATTTNVAGVFSASRGITNSPDVLVYQNWFAGQTDQNTAASNYKILTGATGTSGGWSTSSNLRVSGTSVGLGVQIQNPLGTPAGTGINTSSSGTNLQNDSELYSGNFATQNFLARASGALTVPATNDWTAAPGTSTVNDITNYRNAVTQQFGDMNTSGTYLVPLAFATTQGAPNAASTPVTATTTVAATTGNNFALGLVGPSGTTVIARTGDLPFGAGGPQFANGGNGTSTGNGVGGFFMKMARNGTVAYDAKFLARGTLISGSNFTPGPGGATTANDDTAWIYSPGSGPAAGHNTQVYQESNNVPTHIDPVTGLTTSNGSATFTGAIAGAGIGGGFSNAGWIYSATSTGGDTVNVSGGNANNTQITMISTVAGGMTPTWVMRQNDIAPGFTAASDVHIGVVNGSTLRMNNAGTVAFPGTLQSTSSAVVKGVQYQFNQFGDQTITSTGVQGNDGAMFAGTPNITGPTGLHSVARTGDVAPGFGAGIYLNVSPSSINPAINNAGDVVFSTGLTHYLPGATIGVLGMTPAASVDTSLQSVNVLWDWNAATGLIPLLYTTQAIEMEPGVFKYVNQFSTGTSGANGDGGSMNLNDAGQLVVWVRLSDTPDPLASATSTSYIVINVPAAGTGSLALLGVGVMARRRRR